jgi:hypothetical protein
MERLSGTGLSWRVKMESHKWGGWLSAVVDDDWADDCLVLILPEPRKQRPVANGPRNSPRQADLQAQGASPVLEASPSSMTTMIRPGSYAGSPVTAPALNSLDDQYTTPTRRPGLPADTAPTPPRMQSPQLRQVRNPANVIDRGSHSWVEILISPSPPREGDNSDAVYWSTILRVRVPRPFVTSAGGQRCDFGFIRADGVKVAPKIELLDASIDGRRADFQVFPGSVSGASYPAAFGSPRRGAAGDPSALEWLSFVRITDPEARYGGTLEILYSVENPEVGLSPLEVLLPTFTLAVSRLEITVADIAGEYWLLHVLRMFTYLSFRLPSHCGAIEHAFNNQVSSSISTLYGPAVPRTASHSPPKTIQDAVSQCRSPRLLAVHPCSHGASPGFRPRHSAPS